MIDKLDELGLWNVESPPAGFADRVLAEAHEEPRPAARPPRSRAWIALVSVAAAAALVVTAASVYLASDTPPDSRGAVETAQRRTLEIPGRAIVVSEPGTALEWNTEDGDTRVVQRRGSAFYRVDPGDVFEVVTPAGFVRVTGTCFTVEVKDMHTDKNRGLIKGAALGAALTAAVVVTVYEGKVVLANDKGEVAVSAGQRAVAGKDHAPRMDDDASPGDASESNTVAALRAQNRANQRELQRLREQIAERESGPPPTVAEEGDGAVMNPYVITSDPGFSYFEPTPDVLEKMADCGIVAWDQPDVARDSGGFDDAWAQTAELDQGEREQLDKAYGQFQERSLEQLRSFYEELGGDGETAAKFTAAELVNLLYSRLDMQELVAVREAIAREKAGRETPPDEQSVVGRFMRWEAALGDTFERELGRHLGPDRARELRVAADGWGGKRLTFTNLCEGD